MLVPPNHGDHTRNDTLSLPVDLFQPCNVLTAGVTVVAIYADMPTAKRHPALISTRKPDRM